MLSVVFGVVALEENIKFHYRVTHQGVLQVFADIKPKVVF